MIFKFPFGYCENVYNAELKMSRTRRFDGVEYLKKQVFHNRLTKKKGRWCGADFIFSYSNEDEISV